MSPDLKMTITGIQKLQRANSKMIKALEPANALGRAVKLALLSALRYARVITHVDTGALKASHFMMYDAGAPSGSIFISPDTRNPRTNEPPSIYGQIEHDRAGTHAFYARVIAERGDRIGKRALKILTAEFPKGD